MTVARRGGPRDQVTCRVSLTSRGNPSGLLEDKQKGQTIRQNRKIGDFGELYTQHGDVNMRPTIPEDMCIVVTAEWGYSTNASLFVGGSIM